MDTEKVRRYTVAQSREEGFNLESCFDQAKAKEHGYVKDSDYYFDSYSHFSMYKIP